MLDVFVGAISLLLIGAGLCYFLATMGTGLVETRRHRRRLAAVPVIPGGTAHAKSLSVYFLVPCLNEEAVIGSTLAGLLAHPGARVVVVDDASEDRTAAVVSSFGGDDVLLVSRTMPDARKGKGPALNRGFQAIVADARARALDPALVLVCVMDADGHLSEGAFDHVLPLFEDPVVGGVQLGVRIINRSANLLTTMQDFEFWGISAPSQMGRIRAGTVSLGGNGQFTRLSALLELGPQPWSAALTEDLDLTITLMLAGWRLTSTPSASVYQQGLTSVRRLIRQRTRWFQGHMSCIGRLRSLWKCRTLSNLALTEVSVYLLIPWLFVLPWSILFHIAVWQMVVNFSLLSEVGGGWYGRLSLGLTVAFWYSMAFAPSIFAGYVYYRQEAKVGRLKAVGLGHMLVPYNYVAFASCWMAAVRNLRGRTKWDKTARQPGGVVVGPALAALSALSAQPASAAVLEPAVLGPPIPRPERPDRGSCRRLVVEGTVSWDPPRPRHGYRPVVVNGRFRPSSPQGVEVFVPAVPGAPVA